MAGVHDYDFHNGSTGILGVLKEPRSEDSSESDDEAKESDIQEKDQPSTVSVDAALATSPQNHTACSPQLLHLGHTGRPLWLNGWISQNKFSAPDDVDIDAFQVFLTEPAKKNPLSKTEIWELKENNVCCLTVDNFSDISDHDKNLLQMMISLAKQYEWEV
jgi:alpha 1,3-mannosyltransferase